MANNFEWDYKAAGDLFLKSEEIARVCEAEAARMTQATGVEYVPDVRVGTQRVRAKIGGSKGTRICPKCGQRHPNCDCFE